MKRTVHVSTAIVLTSLFLLSGCAKKPASYYRRVRIDGRYAIVGAYPVADDQAKKTNCYHFVYDEKGRVTKVEYLAHFKGGWWHLLNIPFYLFQMDLPPALGLGVNGVTIEYGDGYEKWTYLDSEGKPTNRDFLFGRIYSIRLKLNERDQRVSLSNLDKKGNLAEDHYGVAQYVWPLDEKGRRIKAIFLDKKGERIVTRNGVGEVHYKYDDKGNMIEEQFCTPDGKPIADDKGVAMKRLQYDAHGNMIAVSGYDTRGKLIEDEKGEAVSRFKYDGNGSLVEMRWCGADEPGQKGECIIFRLKYDEGERWLEVSFYDANNTLQEGPEDCAINHERYDERGNIIEQRCYGVDQRLKEVQKSGIAITRYAYDQQGNKVEERYYGADEKQKEKKDVDVAGIGWKRNDQGKAVEVKYYGADGKLKEDKRGSAMVRYEYDGKGNMIEEGSYGADEKLKEDKASGIAITRHVYDEKGHEVEKRYYGADGKLKENKMWGIAIARHEYDKHGNEVEFRQYGGDGELKEDEKGIAMRRYVRDERGKVTKTIYLNKDGKVVKEE